MDADIPKVWSRADFREVFERVARDRPFRAAALEYLDDALFVLRFTERRANLRIAQPRVNGRFAPYPMTKE